MNHENGIHGYTNISNQTNHHNMKLNNLYVQAKDVSCTVISVRHFSKYCLLIHSLCHDYLTTKYMTDHYI